MPTSYNVTTVDLHDFSCGAAEMAAGGARLIVRRDNIAASTRYVAHVPALALLAGKMRICFVGEPGQDGGGVFREYMSLVAAALGASSLLEPAPDGGLLPAAGQAARQRRPARRSIRAARAASSDVDVGLGLGNQRRAAAAAAAAIRWRCS